MSKKFKGKTARDEKKKKMRELRRPKEAFYCPRETRRKRGWGGDGVLGEGK